MRFRSNSLIVYDNIILKCYNSTNLSNFMLFVRGERATLYSALAAKRNVKRDLCGVTIFKNVTFGKIYVTNVKALYLLK